MDVVALEERFGSLGFREDWDGRLHVVGWLGRWVLNWDDGLIVRGDGGNCGWRRRAGAWMGERRDHDYTDFEGNRHVNIVHHKPEMWRRECTFGEATNLAEMYDFKLQLMISSLFETCIFRIDEPNTVRVSFGKNFLFMYMFVCSRAMSGKQKKLVNNGCD